MRHHSLPLCHDPRSRAPRGGFTLIQMLLVIGLISLLSAILVGQFGRGRAAVRRAECDVHLKEIVLATDTFRQETGKLPAQLMELQTKGYLPLATLRCSADPDLATQGASGTYASYTDFYVARDANDDGELPIIVCPFHEEEGGHGAQGFKGGFTKTFEARPALLTEIAGVVTVTRPGDGVLAIPTSKRLEVRGGDRIKLGAGTAKLTFVDGSSASLLNNSEMSVLESYLESQDRDSIYTLVRQFAGTISYSVIPGNRFDVATPTATAGALGTEFSIQVIESREGLVNNSRVVYPPQTVLAVTEHAVALTTQGRTIEVDSTDGKINSEDPANRLRPRAPRDAKARKIKKGKNSAADKDKQKKDEKKAKKDRDEDDDNDEDED